MKGLLLLFKLSGAFVLLNIIKATAQSESLSSCNSCCQGPVGGQGTPGIPGIPGTNGVAGSLGPKGERGESIVGRKGDPGLAGDIGRPGLKGERGIDGIQGLPGKLGPGGIPGPRGAPGVSGPKGDMGQTRVSAFSAVRTSSFTPTARQALPFEQVDTNIGEDFVAGTGRFTCEIPGIYLFTYSIFTNQHEPLIHLMKNEIHINSVFRANENRYDTISNSAVLQLAAGDKIWLRCYHAGVVVHSNSNKYTTFSGVIIHEI